MKISFSPKKIIFLLLAGFILVTGLISIRRALKGSNDFDTYYWAGRAALASNTSTPRDGTSGIYHFQNPSISPFIYPPCASLFFGLLAWMPIGLAAFVWNFFLIFIFFHSFVILAKLFGLKTLPDTFKQMPLWDKALGSALIVSIFIDNLTMAQINLLPAYLLWWMLIFWTSKRPFRAGLFLSAAITLKVTPALLIFYFIIRKEWRFLSGLICGALFFILFPTLFFGPQLNGVYHKQWIGKSIKTSFAEIQTDASLTKQERRELQQLSNNLIPKNQSLEGALTRLFLKNRNTLVNDPKYPIYVVRHYLKLPVLAGGLEQKKLRMTVIGLQLTLFAALLTVWWQGRKQNRLDLQSAELSLGILSMTLLAPSVRTHQYAYWLLPIFLLYTQPFAHAQNWRHWIVRFCSFFYFLLSWKYAQAAGVGTWANLILWTGFLYGLIKFPRRDSPLPGQMTT